MSETNKKVAIYIVPRSSYAWRGNEAGWITTAGWAAAGQELWGESIVATTDGLFAPKECMLFPRGKAPKRTTGKSKLGVFRKLIPEVLITAYKDWNLKRSKPAIWPIETASELEEKQVQMVWQRHDLFPGPGRRLADKLGVPLVTSVEAAAVWEAKKWGVHRPIWGNWLERKYEAKSLQESDLVSCVSEEVRQKVIDLGIAASKVIVSHNRVDSTVFHPGIVGAEIRNELGLNGKTVLGWTGSFRNFHGLPTVVRAFKKVNKNHPDTVLLLVGEGSEYDRIKALAKELGVEDKVVMPGKKAFVQIPDYVASFDIALVSAQSAEGFHYSPLKLREYLALGKPIIAPKAGNLPELFEDGKDLLLYDTGDEDHLANQMLRLVSNTEMRKDFSENAMRLFEIEGTWIHELKKVCDILKLPY